MNKQTAYEVVKTVLSEHLENVPVTLTDKQKQTWRRDTKLALKALETFKPEAIEADIMELF